MIVVFSGYNQRAVIAFLRCLKRNNVQDYLIVAASSNDTILKTSYRDKVFCIREYKELNKEEIFNILLKIGSKTSEKLLIPPTTEALNRFLLTYREELELYQCVIPLPHKELYEEISDKESFWNLCKGNGLLVPETVMLKEKYERPYVAKPKRYYSHTGKVFSPLLILTEGDHKDFLNKYDIQDFNLQEYVLGNSYYLLFYFSKNGQVYKFSQINYAQQPNGKSILAASTAHIHEENIAQKYISLFEKLKYCGFVMVELRENNGDYYMIEANPRFWGPSQLFVDAGVPFFEIFLMDYYRTESFIVSEINYNAKYLWSGGFEKEQTDGNNCVWLGNGKRTVKEQWEQYIAADIYKRSDTIKIYKMESCQKDGGI